MIDEEFLDDLVEEWHMTPDTRDGRGLVEFLSDRLGWTHDQVKHWIGTAEQPE